MAQKVDGSQELGLPDSAYSRAWLSAPGASLTLGQVSVVDTVEGTGQVQGRAEQGSLFASLLLCACVLLPRGAEYIIPLSSLFVTHSRKGMCNRTGNMLELLLIQCSL